MTRRALGVKLAIATGAQAQPTPDAQQLLDQARSSQVRNRETMQRVSLPLDIEPAAVFKA